MDFMMRYLENTEMLLFGNYLTKFLIIYL